MHERKFVLFPAQDFGDRLEVNPLFFSRTSLPLVMQGSVRCRELCLGLVRVRRCAAPVHRASCRRAPGNGVLLPRALVSFECLIAVPVRLCAPLTRFMRIFVVACSLRPAFSALTDSLKRSWPSKRRISYGTPIRSLSCDGSRPSLFAPGNCRGQCSLFRRYQLLL